MNLQPAPGRIVVSPMQYAETSPKKIGSFCPENPSPVGGALCAVPPTSKCASGRVVAFGERGKDYMGRPEILLKVGDIVIYPEWSGSVVQISGRNYTFISYSDVWGTKRKPK